MLNIKATIMIMIEILFVILFFVLMLRLFVFFNQKIIVFKHNDSVIFKNKQGVYKNGVVTTIYKKNLIIRENNGVKRLIDKRECSHLI